MIEGLLVAGFSEVSGLQAETEVEEVREGGVNDYVYKLPKGTKYQNLTLKKGMTISNDLWDWHRNVVAGKIRAAGKQRTGACAECPEQVAEIAWADAQEIIRVNPRGR